MHQITEVTKYEDKMLFTQISKIIHILRTVDIK